MGAIEGLIEQLNEMSITQESIDFHEDLPEWMYEGFFKGAKILASELDVDKHRHYELATDVIELLGEPVGVCRITQMYSESSSVGDIFHTLEFFKMKEVKSITYEKA